MFWLDWVINSSKLEKQSGSISGKDEGCWPRNFFFSLFQRRWRFVQIERRLWRSRDFFCVRDKETKFCGELTGSHCAREVVPIMIRCAFRTTKEISTRGAWDQPGFTEWSRGSSPARLDLERSNGEQLHQCLYEAASLESISWTGPVRNQPGVEKVGIDLDRITGGGW